MGDNNGRQHGQSPLVGAFVPVHQGGDGIDQERHHDQDCVVISLPRLFSIKKIACPLMMRIATCFSYFQFLIFILYKDHERYQMDREAFRQLRKIKDTHASKRIYQEAQNLAHFPECKNIKRLVNHRYGYRLRVGD
ncbi:hypothetical protein JWG43_04400 [Desulfobulbus alkaliphilus]|nr:hypothetical protein [Desulfobulbus alkaliphilus]MBM9536306.1 hypothetical protein [Desulfobulbus alkaliphilus]